MAVTGILRTHCALCLMAAGLCCLGCEVAGRQQLQRDITSGIALPAATASSTALSAPLVKLAAHQQESVPAPSPPAGDFGTPSWPSADQAQLRGESLADLETVADQGNPALRRLREEAEAQWAQVDYVDKLPDPTVSSMFFLPPMNMEPDRQVVELQVMQMIPWLGRLNAEARRAYLEALAAENEYDSERLRVMADVRAAWFQLYVLGKQIETTEADQAQLEALIATANAAVATGTAQPGDVLMATLELSSLEEQLLTFRQQLAATKAELNRLLGRAASCPLPVPTVIDAELPQWNYELLRAVAMDSQPELNAARLRTAATRWGIEVARLRRRPDLTVSGGRMVMDAPGNPNAGGDSWMLGFAATVPIHHRKYDAIVSEAAREHNAAHASEDEVALRLDARLFELWEQALAAARTVELYETTILPQARQTFEANQQALANNTVTFDRVIRDYRTLLNLELGYHRALGQLATTLARIRQTVGEDLLAAPEPFAP